MNEVFIDVRDTGIEKHFDTDLVSIEQLIVCIENQDAEIENLKEKIEDLEMPEEEKWTNYWIDRGMDKARGDL